ncbi:MAG: DinB family protein [Phycisphaerales bacterium]|nr:DinB family protein [Phycisphaerales bacterium]
MKSLADRFRAWYQHERDCNAKMVEMLRSVPAEARARPEFEKALAKTTHLILAREIWLARLGVGPAGAGAATAPPSWDSRTATLEELPARFERVERMWEEYLARLDEDELARRFEWSRPDGQRWRWDVEGVLTQVNGHAWYHRGQVASLVAGLGGRAVDTDYIFWARPEKLV